jgi:hypothetical protein
MTGSGVSSAGGAGSVGFGCGFGFSSAFAGGFFCGGGGAFVPKRITRYSPR